MGTHVNYIPLMFDEEEDKEDEFMTETADKEYTNISKHMGKLFVYMTIA